MATGYLLDTNHLGQAVTSGSLVRQKIVESGVGSVDGRDFEALPDVATVNWLADAGTHG